jgi:hypothetical protein
MGIRSRSHHRRNTFSPRHCARASRFRPRGGHHPPHNATQRPRTTGCADRSGPAGAHRPPGPDTGPHETTPVRSHPRPPQPSCYELSTRATTPHTGPAVPTGPNRLRVMPISRPVRARCIRALGRFHNRFHRAHPSAAQWPSGCRPVGRPDRIGGVRGTRGHDNNDGCITIFSFIT